MAIDALVEPLLKVPLFQGLRPMQITEIARRAHRVVFQPGDVIVEADRAEDGAMLIVAGEAVRVSGPDFSGVAEPVQVGSLLSEMTMIIETESSSTFVARTTVRALRISRDELLEQMSEDTALADHFIERISGRLSEFVSELRDVDAVLSGEAEGVSYPPVNTLPGVDVETPSHQPVH